MDEEVWKWYKMMTNKVARDTTTDEVVVVQFDSRELFGIGWKVIDVCKCKECRFERIGN